MIITRTPYRISFFGGGTDYPKYYNEYGGAVLSTTINKYCYINCRELPPFFDFKYHIRYSKFETTNFLDDVKHPSVRECLRYLNIEKNIEMAHTGDIPARSGIGSSSAFTVGFLHALYALQGMMVTKRQLAYDAIHVEQEMIKENVGSQDQVAAAFGGFNKIEFDTTRKLWVTPVTLNSEKLDELQSRFLLYFTGLSRIGSDIAKEQIRKTPQISKELGEMYTRVDEALSILNSRDENLDDFGRLLHESWMQKKGLTEKISTKEIDGIYDEAMNAGALGGKLCGAGGGGFILLYVSPGRQDKVKKRLKGLLNVPFRFENIGSHVIFYST
ncbi:kinase [Thermodesulfobacteriota bacterium]